MKKSRVQFLAIFTAFAAVILGISFGSGSGHGQAKPPKKESPVKPTVLISNTATANPKSPSPFAAAADQNSVLRKELAWTFGGKQQRGWYLYDPLIGQTLNTESEPGSTDFAAALAAWQKKKGLQQNGVLDQETLMALVSHWQGRRLKDKKYAEVDQLVVPDTAEFYDPSRVAELRQVERETYEAYKRMLAAAIADPTLKLGHTEPGQLASAEKFFKIVSAFRSREYQDRLRRQSPKAGSAGLAVNSPHFTGRALDIYVGGDPVDTRDANRAIQVNSPAYRWLVRNAQRFGFRPYFYEPWHWEYVGR